MNQLKKYRKTQIPKPMQHMYSVLLLLQNSNLSNQKKTESKPRFKFSQGWKRIFIPGTFLAFLEQKLKIQSWSSWVYRTDGLEKMKTTLHHLCKLLLATSALNQESREKNLYGEKLIQQSLLYNKKSLLTYLEKNWWRRWFSILWKTKTRTLA